MDGHEFLYQFGPYTLDGRERVLMRDSQPVALAPKALETLLVLLRHSGHLVEKDQLMNEVWPSTYVEEANLTQNISILRKVLGESGSESNFIETVPRRGYRFVMPVRKIREPGQPSTGSDTAAQEPEKTYRFLAILPFVDAGADSKIEYLSDGITESIINSLSQLPQLRVMSRNTVFRYKGKTLDAQRIGKELGVDAVLVGRVNLAAERLVISTELVDVANGWQLWGDTYDRDAKAILEVQDEIAKQISTTLRLRLTGDDEQRLTKRYTENAEAYQAYLHGRYHWSKFTREGLEEATIFFGQAINLDPNYALAYSGIVDCYLRLATNYIPPAGSEPKTAEKIPEGTPPLEAGLEPVKTRYKWDWTGVERELKRATELKSSYPAAHQWHAAYLFALKLFKDSRGANAPHFSPHTVVSVGHDQIPKPSSDEEVHVFCTVAREQLEVGNYEAGYAVLKRWWTIGAWPKVEALSSYAAADLLFTAGALAGCISSARQVRIGQKEAEALLNGSIAMFEHLGSKRRSAECRIELACCYYRQGLFDLARKTLKNVLDALNLEDHDLRSLTLIRLAVIERHSGRLGDALAQLNEASEIVELAGPWVTGRYHQELGSVLKDLASAQCNEYRFDQALVHYLAALNQFEAVGNHRYAAAVANNQGFMLLAFGHLAEAEEHLERARRLFDSLSDIVRRAQVDETLARLYLAAKRFLEAEQAIARAVEALESGDEEALLAEALSTKGLALKKLNRRGEAKVALEGAYRVAERCGDRDGAARALLIILEEMGEDLGTDERIELERRIKKLTGEPIPSSTNERLLKCLKFLGRTA